MSGVGRRPGTTKQPHWKKAGRKSRTKDEAESKKADIARLERMRFTQSEIAARVGVSAGYVCQVLSELRERYRTTQFANTAELVAEKVAQYDEVVRELCAAWEKSKRGVDADGNDVDRAGEAVFLAKVMDALKAQRELLGLDAPTKQDVRAAVLGVSAQSSTRLPVRDGKVSWDAVAGWAGHPDPLQEAINGEQKAIPPGRA